MKKIEELNLSYAEFFTRSYIITSLEKALFYRAFLENMVFIYCEWPDNYIIYEEKEMKDEDVNLTYNELETIYRDLKQNM